MSVYTHITLADVQPFVAGHGLPPAITLVPIKGGIENSNFFLTLTDGRELVLTIFEELGRDEAGFLGPLLAHLTAQGLPVAGPLADRDGLRLGTLADKPAQLAPRLAGLCLLSLINLILPNALRWAGHSPTCILPFWIIRWHERIPTVPHGGRRWQHGAALR
jgi:Ser/Thr protein kinase RdoA (MazF antagonist)